MLFYIFPEVGAFEFGTIFLSVSEGARNIFLDSGLVHNFEDVGKPL